MRNPVKILLFIVVGVVVAAVAVLCASKQDPGFHVAAPDGGFHFDPQSLTWHGPLEPCTTCTPGNGSGADGQIAGVRPVVWQEARFHLRNDAGETPPVAEVRVVFDLHYNADPTRFGTHVSLVGDRFRVIVATERGNTDFFAADGALRAWYIVSGTEPSK